MRNSSYYIRGSSYFLEKLKNILSDNDVVDMTGLYPCIPHSARLKFLKNPPYKQSNKQIPTSNLVKMAEFVFSNNYFEFSEKVFQQILGTVTSRKCASPYACIYVDEAETELLQTERCKPLVLVRYIDNIYFIWTHCEENLNSFMKDLNNFRLNLHITSECDRNSINFLTSI